MNDIYLSGEMIVAIIAIGVGGLIAIVSIFFGIIASIARTSQIERSRRELSAYVAEGSITPDDAERILDAGPKHKA
ncbi:MAG: hypothetical protein AAF995_04500 [Planctomycetota bacterium]